MTIPTLEWPSSSLDELDQSQKPHQPRGPWSWRRHLLLLLALATMAGVGLAALLRPAAVPSTEQQAIEAIRDDGGFVVIQGEESGGVAEWFGSACSGPIIEIEILGSRTGDAVLWKTGVLAHPEALLVLRAPLTDDDLKRLAPFCNLQTLDLCRGHVSNAALVHLKRLTCLRRLAIRNSSRRSATGGTAIDDSGVRHLCELPHLEELILNDTNITDAGLAGICRLPALGTLEIAQTPVTDVGLKHIGGMSGLTHLNLCGTGVTDAGLVHLHGLPYLSWMNLCDTAVTEAGVRELQERMPWCIVITWLQIRTHAEVESEN